MVGEGGMRRLRDDRKTLLGSPERQLVWGSGQRTGPLRLVKINEKKRGRKSSGSDIRNQD
jgi:hypothetical protein